MPRWLLVLLPLAAFAAEPAKPPKPAADLAHAVEALAKGHPRLVLTAARVAQIKDLLRRDPSIRKTYEDVIGGAEATKRDGAPKPNADGNATIAISRGCFYRIVDAALAWHLTGKEEYAQVAHDVVLATCGFASWTANPHPGEEFGMETGEALQGIAIGYDWLYDRFTKEERATIRAAIIAKGLTPGLHDYGVGGKRSWWPGEYVNCTADNDAGLIMAALAIGDEEPQIAREVLTRAIEDIERPIATYDPAGVWPEGPSYWYTTTWAVALGLSSLETACGTCFGLDHHDGLAGTGSFIVSTRSPTGFAANFADSFDWEDLQGMPMLMWLARHYDRPDYARAQIDTINRPHNHGSSLDLVWWPDAPPATAKWPLDARFAGRCDIASMRSGWDDQALYAWVKGGWNDVNHGHLDLAEFELYALGQCWSRDLGRDDYGIPGNHEYQQGGKRWSYFRWGSQGHSVLMIDGEGQNVAGTAQITRFGDGPADPYAIVELTNSYRAAKGVARGMMLVNRRALLVQDEIALAKPCPITWGMTTDALIAVEGAHAVLTINGKRMAASILSPAKAVFSVASGERPKPENPNTGLSRLLIEVPPSSERVRVAVYLAPVWNDGVQPTPALHSLGEWGAKPKPTAKHAGRAKDAPAKSGADEPPTTETPTAPPAQQPTDAPTAAASEPPAATQQPADGEAARALPPSSPPASDAD